MWFSGSLRPFFVQLFCVFLPPLLNLFCFCWVLTVSSFIVPILAWNFPLVSPTFLKRSLVFPTLLFSCISLHWLLRKAVLSLLAIQNSAFRWVYFSFSSLPLASLLFSAIYKASSEAFCNSFSWVWSWSLPTVQCHKPPSIDLQALYQI